MLHDGCYLIPHALVMVGLRCRETNVLRHARNKTPGSVRAAWATLLPSMNAGFLPVSFVMSELIQCVDTSLAPDLSFELNTVKCCMQMLRTQCVDTNVAPLLLFVLNGR